MSVCLFHYLSEGLRSIITMVYIKVGGNRVKENKRGIDMKLGRGMRKEGKEGGKEDVGIIIPFYT